MPNVLQAEECLNPWGLRPASMHNWIINSLAEAREVLAHHTREQRYEGIRKRPNVWFSHIEPGALVIVVTAAYGDHSVIQKPYQYKMTCGAEKIEEIKTLVESKCWLRNINPRTERKRWKDEEAQRKQMKTLRPRRRKEAPKNPMKQLHMFTLA